MGSRWVVETYWTHEAARLGCSSRSCGAYHRWGGEQISTRRGGGEEEMGTPDFFEGGAVINE